MSARMETEQVNWESRIVPETKERALVESEIECRSGAKPEDNGRTALALQEQWDVWFAKRDQMRSEIKRGWEFLEQVQRELAVLRTRLDEWPGYEVVCGKNPLSEYMQAIAAKERIEQYLPSWLKRREEQLHALNRQLEHCARNNSV